MWSSISRHSLRPRLRSFAKSGVHLPPRRIKVLLCHSLRPHNHLGSSPPKEVHMPHFSSSSVSLEEISFDHIIHQRGMHAAAEYRGSRGDSREHALSAFRASHFYLP